jgi:hypothetical protein
MQLLSFPSKTQLSYENFRNFPNLEKLCLKSGCQGKRKTGLSFVFEFTWQKGLQVLRNKE